MSNMVLKSRVGLYAWGGPGTIRLLNTKYFSPRIDRDSFLTLYDKPFLDAAEKVFGITDMWVTYSWGFSNAQEQEDYEFITSRLDNFRNRSIKTHAYIQGFNLVLDDWKHRNVFCRNEKGNILYYSKGRGFTCPSNPEAIEIIRRRIERAAGEQFDGIFVDNILFGLPPVSIYKNYLPFSGCSCIFCEKAFKRMFGYRLPVGEKRGERVINDYLAFRCTQTARAVKKFSSIVGQAGKEFGINLYDPWWHQSEYFFGYRLSDINGYLDYHLIENHALSSRSISNQHLLPLLKQSYKPTFIVSYDKGIGRDKQYTNQQMSAIRLESQNLRYNPCYKATEYKTKGVWHALRINDLPSIVTHQGKQRRVSSHSSPAKALRSLSGIELVWVRLFHQSIIWGMNEMYRYRLLFMLCISSPLYTMAMKRKFHPILNSPKNQD